MAFCILKSSSQSGILSRKFVIVRWIPFLPKECFALSKEFCTCSWNFAFVTDILFKQEYSFHFFLLLVREIFCLLPIILLWQESSYYDRNILHVTGNFSHDRHVLTMRRSFFLSKEITHFLLFCTHFLDFASSQQQKAVVLTKISCKV